MPDSSIELKARLQAEAGAAIEQLLGTRSVTST